MIAERCGTCAYWRRGGAPLSAASRHATPKHDVGTCEHLSPIVVDMGFGVAAGVYPETHESRGCSDWMTVWTPDGDDGDRDGNVHPLRPMS